MDAKYDRIDGIFQQAAEAWYATKIEGTISVLSRMWVDFEAK